MKKLLILLLFSLALLPVSTQVYAGDRDIFFGVADEDKNASLDKKEFRQFINLLAKSGHSNAKRVKTFRLYSLAWAFVDKDADGYATLRELKSANDFHMKDKKKRVASAT